MQAKPDSGYSRYFAWLVSMRSAIYLLILLGGVMALGTMIPQGQTPSYYVRTYGNLTGTLMVHLSLDHLYQSVWFYALVGLICLSVFICAYRRLRRVHSLAAAGSLLFHIAIVVVLGGAAWSLGYARSTTVDIPEQQTISLAEHGLGSGQLTLQSFRIDYYPDYQPRQYISDLLLSGYEGQDYQQKIYVNSPLRAGNLKIYQSSWGWVFRLNMAREGVANPITLKEYDSFRLDDEEDYSLRAVFFPDFAENQRGIFSQTPVPNNPYVGLTLMQAEKIVDMALVPVGQEAQMGPYLFTFDNFSYYSGLQIKYDPGIKIVFAGFILLLAGLLGRYWRVFFAPKGD